MKKYFLILFVILLSNSTFAQKNPNSKCRIWQTSNYCVMPDSVVYFKTINCNNCNWDLYPCASLSDFDLPVVWLTITGNWTTLTLNHDSTFTVLNQLKNISVIKKSSGKRVYPYAILLDGHPDYMKSKFTANKYFVTYNPKKRFDLFVIFEDAEKGDTFKIDGFIVAEIK